MELLYILLIAAVAICIFLAVCICCFANSRYCHCIDIIYDDAEDSEPIKSKNATSSRELNRSEYYSNTTPILGSSKIIQQSDFTNNGQKYSPMLSQHSSSKPLDDETTTSTTFYTSPDSHTTVTETHSTRKGFYPSDPFKNETTSYSTTSNFYPPETFKNETTRNVYPAEPYRHDTASYSTTKTQPSKNRTGYSTEMSYSSERALPTQVTTRSSNVAPQSQSYSSVDAGYQSGAPQQYPLRKAGSQTSLYENN